MVILNDQIESIKSVHQLTRTNFKKFYLDFEILKLVI